MRSTPTMRAAPKLLKRPLLTSSPRHAPLISQTYAPRAGISISSSPQPSKNQVFDPVRNPNALYTYISLSTGAQTPLLTLWTASWCPSCRTVAPLIRSLIEEERVGEEHGGVNYVPVEFDSPDIGSLASDYMITSIPTLLAFDPRRGEPAARLVDARKMADRQGLIDWINEQAKTGGSSGGNGTGGGSAFGGLFGNWK